MNQRLPVAPPLEPARFLAAVGTIIDHLEETTGQSLHLVGDTRVLVPLAFLLKGQGFDQEEIISVVIRMRALQLLLDQGTLDEWVYPDGDGPLHTAVLDEAVGIAAAALPLNGPNDLFARDTFLARVREIVTARQPGQARLTLEIPVP